MSLLLQSYNAGTNYTGYLSLRIIFRRNKHWTVAVTQGTVPRACWVVLSEVLAESSSTLIQKNKCEISHLFIQNIECFRTILAPLNPRLTPHPKEKLHISEVKLQKEFVFIMHVNYISNEVTPLFWLCILDAQVLPAPQEQRYKWEIRDTS